MEFTTILEDLNFADDIAPLSSGMNHLQQKTTQLENNAAKGSLKLNNKKCKVIKVKSKRDDKLKVRESEVEEVESFTYLGTNITKDGGGTADINKRIALASAHIKRLSNIWKASEICRKTKSSLFKSLALSIQVERNSAGWNKWTSSMQLLTDISGEIMSEPYVPGTESIKDTFPIRNSIHKKYGPEDESLKLPDNQDI